MLESIKEYIRRQFDRYDEKKSTAVQVVEELPSDVENRVYITEDEESNRKVYAKDIELQRADAAVLTVNEQEADENQNITVDGSNTKATYEEETDYINALLPKVGAVKEVETLPAVPDKRVYIDKDGKVYAKDIELQKAEDAVKSVNEQTADENGNITVDGSNTEATYEGEKDFIDNLLPKVGTVKTVDELPTPIDDRMYIVGSRVFAKLIELLTKEEAEDTFIPLDEKGEADGVATLDQYGKVPVSQLPSALLEYMGVWNAETNTPELSNDTVTEENKGNVYICNVAGTWNGIEFHAGDWIICNGEIWQRSTADDLVKSVNGQQGIVELDGSNVKATYEGETDFINNLLPKVGKVKAVNEQLPDDQGNITVDGDSINVVYEDEEDTLNNTLPKLGKVKTVNNTPPDADGNIKIPALEVVDKVEAGNMAAVTSNAVSKALTKTVYRTATLLKTSGEAVKNNDLYKLSVPNGLYIVIFYARADEVNIEQRARFFPYIKPYGSEISGGSNDTTNTTGFCLVNFIEVTTGEIISGIYSEAEFNLNPYWGTLSAVRLA